MTAEIIAVIVIVGVLAAALGYLFASKRSSAKLIVTEQALQQAILSVAQLAQSKSDIEVTLVNLQSQYHTLEMSNNTLIAQHAALNDKYSSLDKSQKEIATQLADAVKNCHAAETAKQASATELAENKKSQADLQERLKLTEASVLDERKKLEEQVQKNAALDKQAKAAEVKAQETEFKYQDLKSDTEKLQLKFEVLQREYSNLQSAQAELKTSLDERDANHKQQLEQFSEQKAVLSKEFENLANKIFEEKGRTFTDTSKTSIDTMLQPFREQIEGFQKRINEVHDASLKGNEGIGNQIKSVLEIGLKMSQEANNLASALKGDSQQRGAWGEAQLERTLEMSGLVEDTHYEKQSSFKDLEGKQKKTDYLIKLPDNKHIIIDSKVSLVAYDKAISAETPELLTLAMAEHVNAVKRHIDELASKDYTNLVGVHSPSFVLMFMPIEPAYIDALKSNKDLFGYGYAKNIVLVSHTTLIPILRTVANLWMMHRSNTEAREISEKAGEIYNQVCTVAERLQKLGGSLGAVSNHYNNTVKALVGQQGLHGKVERFSQLSAKVSKSMPELEPTHIDFETERLLLIAEPVMEQNLELEVAEQISSLLQNEQPTLTEETN